MITRRCAPQIVVSFLLIIFATAGQHGAEEELSHMWILCRPESIPVAVRRTVTEIESAAIEATRVAEARVKPITRG